MKTQVVPPFLDILSKRLMDLSQLDWWRFYGRVIKRLQEGMEKYQVPLTTHNGRDSLQDAWEEACDGSQYLMQAYLEGKLPDLRLIEDQIDLLGKIEKARAAFQKEEEIVRPRD
jgi:hypothetical protein